MGWGAALSSILKVFAHVTAYFARKQLLDAGADRATRAAQAHALRQAELAARARAGARADGVRETDFRPD